MGDDHRSYVRDIWRLCGDAAAMFYQGVSEFWLISELGQGEAALNRLCFESGVVDWSGGVIGRLERECSRRVGSKRVDCVSKV